ncbi:MAG: (2Fe-2S)-binding protein [Dehalococcoidia bacterium]
MATSDIDTTINGERVQAAVEVGRSLASWLRDDLELTGTKVSCELQICGACTVLVDGGPVSACTFLAVDAHNRTLLTIEGLAGGEALHPLQQAFIDNFGMQCGFCTPGFLMMAKALLDENPSPTPAEIRSYLDGNICRCTGYGPIVAAVRDAADRMANPDVRVPDTHQA